MSNNNFFAKYTITTGFFYCSAGLTRRPGRTALFESEDLVAIAKQMVREDKLFKDYINRPPTVVPHKHAVRRAVRTAFEETAKQWVRWSEWYLIPTDRKWHQNGWESLQTVRKFACPSESNKMYKLIMKHGTKQHIPQSKAVSKKYK